MLGNYSKSPFWQEIDAALISVISFPAFAVDDADVIINTRDEIRQKLMVRTKNVEAYEEKHATFKNYAADCIVDRKEYL